jgi:tetratricopeptide (TPR) repeat protein
MKIRALGIALAGTIVAGSLPAQAPRLGTISFPTSGAAAAQPAFIRGVLYLHSFEYASAASAFREAERLDPAFALAYWGEAMTYTHPVWNQQDLDSARMVLARLGASPAERGAKAPTARERGYLAAVEALYGEGSKQRRDTLFSRAMLKLMDDFPDDIEARSFAALGLLGLNQGVRDVATYMRAAALVEPVFAANPDHPGAAHYLIHSFDDPVHAPLGLPAARAYSRIAPDAAHAQHMTTHIFLAAGMWDETISQNVIAASQTAWVPGHYTEWLGYGYAQAGRFREGAALLERVRANIRTPRQRAELGFMRAQHLLATEEWNSPMWAWDVDVSASPLHAAVDAFARAMGAMGRERIDSVRTQTAAVHAALARARAGDSLLAAKVEVIDHQATAMERMLSGPDIDAMIAELRTAARLEDALPMDFGPPEIVKPAHELLADFLLGQWKFADAQREYTIALQRAPGRLRSLIGLVRAAARAGDRDVAADAYRRLAASLHAADADLRVLNELQPLLASR